MSTEKKILDFDKNELFISSRVCEFMVHNALKVNVSDGFLKTVTEFIKEHNLFEQGFKRYSYKVLAEFIIICRKANFSNEQFYLVGNKNHEIHVLVSSFTNERIECPINWNEELNIMRMNIEFLKLTISLSVELHKSLILDFKKTAEPVLHIMNGFLDRIHSNLFNSKASATIKKSSLNLLHTRSEVSNFDIVNYISNEQIAYSRLKRLIEKEQKESIVEKISFYLFKDIGFSVEEIALKLNISIRSLQRKLKAEDSSFRSIKESVRKELSKKYLEDKSLSIHDVCLLLSYSERGAFEKAFKKWYGKNPTEYRKQLG